jgi:hypothetical protein
MAIAGTILLLLGAGLLFLAGCFFLATVLPRGGWDLFSNLYWPLTGIFGVPGFFACWFGFDMVRKAQRRRN